jgi:hypothetical protein
MAPPEAAWFRVTVQVEELPESNVAGLQVSEETPGATREIVKLRDTPFKLAVTTTV